MKFQREKEKKKNEFRMFSWANDIIQERVKCKNFWMNVWQYHLSYVWQFSV